MVLWAVLAIGAAQLPALDPRYREAVRAYRIVRAGEGGREGELTDRDGHVHRNYGEGLILVRPDGYLGYTGPDGGGVNAYLARFFG